MDQQIDDKQISQNKLTSETKTLYEQNRDESLFFQSLIDYCLIGFQQAGKLF